MFLTLNFGIKTFLTYLMVFQIFSKGHIKQICSHKCTQHSQNRPAFLYNIGLNTFLISSGVLTDVVIGCLGILVIR